MNGIAGEHSLPLPSVDVERTRFNPPGKSQLVYRGGTFLATLERMLIRLPRQVIPGPNGSPDLMPFARFNVASDDDWTVALLHAWAAVTDVLGFYHERIVNEGYLRTASERLSVIQLARTVGYELQPGLAAGAMLAFTVVQGLGEPPRTVFVPKGTAAQSVPPPKSGMHQGTPASSMPQVFETSDDFVARSDWNLLRPVARGEWTGEHRILPGTNSLRVLGSRTDLRKGDRLLFVGQDPANAQRQLWQLAQVKSAAPNAAGFTAVTWEGVPGLPAGPLPILGPDPAPDAEPQAMAAPQLFVLRQQAKLFTYTTAGVYRTWPAPESRGEADAEDVASSGRAGGQAPTAAVGAQSQPVATAGWWPAGIGLPHEPVELIVSTRSGHLLAVTQKSIHRSIDGGATWQLTGMALQSRHVTALAEGEDGTLYAGTDKGDVHLSQDEGETWRQAAGEPIYLPARGLHKLVPAILSSTGHLPEVVVSSLAAYRSGGQDVLAAGTDSGVFLSTNRGRQWKTANLVLPKLDRATGLAKVSVHALSVVQAGKRSRLYAGTDEGVFPIRATPSATPVVVAGLVLAMLHRLLLAKHSVLRSLADAALIAAAIGVVIVAWWLIWRFLNNRPARRIAGTPPPTAQPPALPGKLPSEKVLAQQLAAKNPAVDVRDLKASPAGLVAGTGQGIYLAAGPGPQPHDKRLRRLVARLVQIAFPGLLSGWTQLDAAPQAQPDVQSLTLSEPDSLLAATEAGAVYLYRYVDNTWQLEEPNGAPPALTGIAGTAALPAGLFLAGTPPKAKVDPAWSPWQLQEHAIHLDSVPDGIAAGSWLVLQSTGAGQNGQAVPLPQVFRVLKSERSDSNDAGKKQPVTRVVVDRSDTLDRYDRTAALALFQTEALELYDDEPVHGTTLQLNSFVPNLKTGHYVIVSGKRMRARLAAPANANVKLVALSGLQTIPIQPGESLILLGPPQRQAAPDGDAANESHGASAQIARPTDKQPATEIWRLRNRDGVEGEVKIEASVNGAAPQFIVEPPHDDDPEVNELAVIYAITASADHTTLTLTTDLSAEDRTLKPLANILERTTATLCANVVGATHGSTVPAEVLGSSDGSQANQRFMVRQAPLTYISTATPEGRQSTLGIAVAGVRWRQVPFLYGHPRDERVYLVQYDEQGRAIITFGDGRAGARLPSTREEVRASYRIGNGEVGNLPADSITQLRAAPPGLKAVTNPIAASGGVDPETNDSIRANAPLALRAMHRIVSLSDYEEFVRSFAGIGRVQAKMFNRVHGGLLHLTIADAAGNPLSPASDLYANLLKAIERARIAPTPRLRVDSYEPVFFDVALKVMIDRDFKAQQSTIEQQAERALRSAFTFQHRAFGQGVSASEIITLVQPIAGVVGVEIEQLAYHGSSLPQAPPSFLAAQPTRWRQGAALPAPAQMLLINSQGPDGITIAMEFVA